MRHTANWAALWCRQSSSHPKKSRKQSFDELDIGAIIRCVNQSERGRWAADAEGRFQCRERFTPEEQVSPTCFLQRNRALYNHPTVITPTESQTLPLIRGRYWVSVQHRPHGPTSTTHVSPAVVIKHDCVQSISNHVGIYCHRLLDLFKRNIAKTSPRMLRFISSVLSGHLSATWRSRRRKRRRSWARQERLRQL